jgi:GTP cyclohydrolase I
MSSMPKLDGDIADTPAVKPVSTTRPKVDQREVEAAVRTLIAWAGDDPDREELLATPARVAEAFQEYFRGYREDALAWLHDADIDMARGYDDIIMLRDVRLQSFCEHHLTPFEGRAHVAYLPGQKVVGLSRLARVVDTLAKRLQTQEALTQQIAETIEAGLKPRGVAVLIEAEHQCMSLRGVRQSGVAALTHRFFGEFATDGELRERFMRLAGR